MTSMEQWRTKRNQSVSSSRGRTLFTFARLFCPAQIVFCGNLPASRLRAESTTSQKQQPRRSCSLLSLRWPMGRRIKRRPDVAPASAHPARESRIAANLSRQKEKTASLLGFLLFASSPIEDSSEAMHISILIPPKLSVGNLCDCQSQSFRSSARKQNAFLCTRPPLLFARTLYLFTGMTNAAKFVCYA